LVGHEILTDPRTEGDALREVLVVEDEVVRRTSSSGGVSSTWREKARYPCGYSDSLTPSRMFLHEGDGTVVETYL
jgi:hypothetical protein